MRVYFDATGEGAREVGVVGDALVPRAACVLALHPDMQDPGGRRQRGHGLRGAVGVVHPRDLQHRAPGDS
jgi:hypothetical protein